jgi:hypothetical protein
VRTVLGTGSLLAMIAISTQGKWLFRAFRRLGLLKPAAEVGASRGG